MAQCPSSQPGNVEIVGEEGLCSWKTASDPDTTVWKVQGCVTVPVTGQHLPVWHWAARLPLPETSIVTKLPWESLFQEMALLMCT